MAERFNSVLYGFDEEIAGVLRKLPLTVKQNTEEIRLRCGLPLALTVAGETVFVKASGQTTFYPTDSLMPVSRKNVDESFKKLCNNSAFAHENELKNGYLRLKNGNRAGVFGTINAKGYMEDITCINVRIAREIKGVSRMLAAAYRGEGWLIAGPPGSGKTTVLRDFIRLISSGASGKSYRVAVIDSRGEISGGKINDLGPATDILNTEDKAIGTEIAIRTMFPEVIAFDEIGTLKELEKVKDGFNAGVSLITTAHIGNMAELLQRSVTSELLQSGVISRFAVLSHPVGSKIRIITAKELYEAYA